MHGKVRGSDFGRQRTASQVANEKSIFQEWPFAGVSGSADLLVVKLVCLLRRASMHPMRDRTPPFASGTDDYLFNHLLIESFKVAANRPPPEPRTPDPAAPAFRAATAAASSSSAACIATRHCYLTIPITAIASSIAWLLPSATATATAATTAILTVASCQGQLMQRRSLEMFSLHICVDGADEVCDRMCARNAS